MSSNGPEDDDPPSPRAELFPYDEMSTGEASSLLRRANQVTGASSPQDRAADPTLKPMTGAQLAFRPSAPPRSTPSGGSAGVPKPTTGSHTAYKPTTGAHAAFKPGSSAPGPRPSTGVQPAFKPSAPNAPVPGKTGTNQFAAFKPADKPNEPTPVEGAEAPVFDQERLQAQIRARAISDSALGRAAKGAPKPTKLPSTAVEDTFVKTKMKQAESKVVDFDLDEDLG